MFYCIIAVIILIYMCCKIANVTLISYMSAKNIINLPILIFSIILAGPCHLIILIRRKHNFVYTIVVHSKILHLLGKWDMLRIFPQYLWIDINYLLSRSIFLLDVINKPENKNRSCKIIVTSINQLCFNCLCDKHNLL